MGLGDVSTPPPQKNGRTEVRPYIYYLPAGALASEE